MIQRWQSVLLFLAGLFGLVSFFLPVAQFSQGGSVEVLYYYGKVNPEGTVTQYTWILGAALAIASGLSWFTIFLYSNRKKQMQFSIYNIAFYFLSVGLVHFFSHTLGNVPEVEQSQMGPALFSPILSLVLVVIAHRLIKKDDELVRSMDRLR